MTINTLAWLSRASSIKLPERFHFERFCAQVQFVSMVDLTRLLPKLLRANTELAVKLAWGRAAGVGLRRQAIPFRLEGRTLIISVADAIWQRQLQPMSAELIYRMNNLLGQSTVAELVFRINPAAVSRAQVDVARPAPKAQPAPVPTELLFAAGSIADQDLRARFLRAAENCIARRDSLTAHD
jgi:Dna[CI] antecedent DciA-like protein